MRITVLHRDCAKVIGKGGREMKQLEARSRARLKVQREDEMDSSTKERYVDITGSANEQKAAVGLILDLVSYCCDEDGNVLKDVRPLPAVDREANPPVVLEVSSEDVGKVIGRGGETIKILEKDSCTKIEVDKATGKVEIYGEKENQDQALELVLAEVSYAKDESGEVLKDTRRPPADLDSAPAPLKLWVKNREAGKIIGRSGETVREIIEKTGADVRVQKSDEMPPGTQEREVSIHGSKEQQDEALEMILAQKLTWIKGEDGMLREPPSPEEKAAASLQEKLEAPLEEHPVRRGGGGRKRFRESNRTGGEGAAAQPDKNTGRPAQDSSRKGRKIGPPQGKFGAAPGRLKFANPPPPPGLFGVGMPGMPLPMHMAMGMPPMPMPGMPPMGPPLLGGPGGPMMPMMGLPGLPGMLPLRRTRSSSGSSDSSYEEYSDAEGSEGSADQGRHGAKKEKPQQPARPTAAAPGFYVNQPAAPPPGVAGRVRGAEAAAFGKQPELRQPSRVAPMFKHDERIDVSDL